EGPAAAARHTRKADSIPCKDISAAGAAPGTPPARTCLQRGGLFHPLRSCGKSPPSEADFDLDNGYYVWPRTVTNGVRPPLSTDACASEAESRSYMTTAQSDDAVTWWKKQTGPRMLAVSYNAIHRPYQKAPTYIVRGPGNR